MLAKVESLSAGVRSMVLMFEVAVIVILADHIVQCSKIECRSGLLINA